MIPERAPAQLSAHVRALHERAHGLASERSCMALLEHIGDLLHGRVDLVQLLLNTERRDEFGRLLVQVTATGPDGWVTGEALLPATGQDLPPATVRRLAVHRPALAPNARKVWAQYEFDEFTAVEVLLADGTRVRIGESVRMAAHLVRATSGTLEAVTTAGARSTGRVA